ncbi:MAG: KAP family NTPase [Bombella sp.]|nr:KAP family NTPase [Bombella sp.]
MTDDYEWAGPNANIAKVLDKYCYGASRPPFALMLDGAWGCGKTWFIKRFFEEKKKNRISDSELGMIYVSLYGIQDAEEITKAIYAAMHPILGGKIGELGKVVFKGLLKSTLKIDLHHLENGKADLSAVLGIPDNTGNKDRIFRNRILVFDDVERAKMPVSDILALVQPLVESHEDRVILVANEKDIAADNEVERDRYERVKEKTIYLSLHLTPDIGKTFKKFITENENGIFISFIEENKEYMYNLIIKSSCSNLRIVDFFMTFGEYLLEYTYEEINNIIYNRNILNIVSILYGVLIENSINKNTFDNIEHIMLFDFNEKFAKDIFSDEYYENIKEKHSKIREKPYFPMMKDQQNTVRIMYQFIKNGILNPDERSYLSNIISNEIHIPTYKKIHSYQQYDKNEYDRLLEEFLEEFHELNVQDDYELIKMCDIYLMLARLNISPFNEEPISTLETYIKRHFKKRLFNQEKDIEAYVDRIFLNEHSHSLMYIERGSESFKEILLFFSKEKNHFIKINVENYVKYKIKKEKALELLGMIKYNNYNYLTENPFLNKIDPSYFLEILNDLIGYSRDMAFSTLNHRFKQSQNTSNPLHPEKEWFEQLHQKLIELINHKHTHPLHRETLKRDALTLYDRIKTT